ncbi:MAG TPA: hypothetical protein VNC84_04180 [Gammaproteobacteria bacterium]|nr:hypothetical protein [Gammaproteobacteria bacterium]
MVKTHSIHMIPHYIILTVSSEKQMNQDFHIDYQALKLRFRR